ncbi:MAG: hypothetical protein ACLTMP_01740 [Eggerthella lenta]
MKKSVLDSSINWEFNQFDGTLRISGTGKMPRFTQNKESGGFDDNPWNPIKNEIATLIVDEELFPFRSGVLKCKNLTKVSCRMYCIYTLEHFTNAAPLRRSRSKKS